MLCERTSERSTRSCFISNMEAGAGGRTRCDWKEDVNLKKDLETYVKKNLKRKEVLDFAKEKYPLYEWSLRTLCRWLNYFGIKYIDYSIDVAEVENAVRKEITGPGRLLGYRAMHQKLREIHGLKVPRNLVNDVMMEVDPEGLKARGNIGRPKTKRKKGAFTSTVSRNHINCYHKYVFGIISVLGCSYLCMQFHCVYYCRS